MRNMRHLGGQQVVFGDTSTFNTKDKSLFATGKPISLARGSDMTFP